MLRKSSPYRLHDILRLALFATGAASACIACSKGSATTPATPRSELNTLQGFTGPARLDLIDAGREPRQRLRYALEPGKRRAMTLELLMVVEALAGGVMTELEAPPIELRVEAGPNELTTAGTVRYPVAVTDATTDFPPDSDPDFIAEVEHEMAQLRQIRGWIESTARGEVATSHFDMPASIQPRTRSLLANIRASLIAVPFPEESVGQGARWAVLRSVTLNDFAVAQEVTYTLAKMASGQGRLEVVFRQSAKPQALSDNEPGISTHLDAYESIGLGSVDYNLKQMTPWSEADATTQMRATLLQGDRRVPLQLRMRTGLQVRPCVNGT